VYPETEPYDQGFLDVGDGNRVYWETCGNPDGKPAVVFHGGPGSGASPWFRTFFDPDAYRLVLFDQRNCGRSTPHASDPGTDLGANTTWHLIADAELLREQLGIEQWLVFGGSWGSTLGLAYSVTHPARVTEIVLSSVTIGRHDEFDWLFRGGLARFFPEQWARLRAAVPDAETDADVVHAYSRRFVHPDADVRKNAAFEWCMWESASPAWPPTTELAERFRDPGYALAFARIVTHYVRANAWLEDGVLLRDAGLLADIPGVLVSGRYDFQAPIANAYELQRAWPRAELVIVDEAGHVPTGELGRQVARATDLFR
jgi:proline iminopeptidase